MALSAAKWGVQKLPKVRPQSAVNIDWNVGKYPGQLNAIQADATKLERKLLKWEYLSGEKCMIGLLNHDFLDETNSEVKEARRRMTDDEVQARYFRMSRALVMSANFQILPEDEWTPMDANHNYLAHRIQEVKNEVTERKLVKCALHDYEDVQDRLSLLTFRMWNYGKIKALRQKLQDQLIAPRLI